MSVDALKDGLAEMGYAARAEDRGRIVVITLESLHALDAATRRRIVSLARNHGYSNVCAELAPLDANLPGD